MQYQQIDERQEEMLDSIDFWQVTLEHEYGKLEELGVTLDDPAEIQDEDELDEDTE